MFLRGILAVVITEYEILADRMIRLQVFVTDLNIYWHHVAEGMGKVLHFFRPCCAPHECLSVWSDLIQNLPDVLFEAHVL